ncbi:hypothetical protein [Mesorhizobium sp.]|uniref:hypothetical protein n=1 Tax=Mesorhizobium sp. TaxID=1871066 RepID=UPI0012078EAA|nr:hypothetical protein [Mesorhizobium sp.]TIL54350.1 MAG: hypothetical protein E5Y83_02590 [Mesorhizobium sp.]
MSTTEALNRGVDLAETIALIRKRMKSGECDLRDVGQILTGRWDQDVPAAIIAAALTAPVPVAVKGLEWIYGEGNHEGQQVWHAGDPWLFWIVKNTGSDKFVWCETLNMDGFVPASPVRGSFDTLEAAKAAAHADYEARIRSALAPTSMKLHFDKEWLKRKILEDGEEGEIGAGFEMIAHPESPATIAAAQRIFEVMCGGPVDWAKHATDTNDDNLFQSADWECCLTYAKAALVPAAQAVPDMRAAIADIAAERQRQINVEGWTPEHDDKHDNAEMAWAAAAYSIGLPRLSGSVQFGKRFLPWLERLWPWDLAWWKPSDRRRNLVKAGALIVAEIERLDRLQEQGGPDHG